MRISTKGKYGLEAIIDLAIHSEQGCVNLKSISERCGVSEAYILQIFLKLRRAGIVTSVRGAQGGYKLSNAPSKTTVRDVLSVLEGPFAPVVCLSNEKKSYCERRNVCASREFWESIMITLNEVAESITIADLVDCYKKATIQMQEPEYYI